MPYDVACWFASISQLLLANTCSPSFQQDDIRAIGPASRACQVPTLTGLIVGHADLANLAWQGALPAEYVPYI